MKIDYNNKTQQIFIFNNWKIDILDIDLNLIQRIKLNIYSTSFIDPLSADISYFKYNESSNDFQIVQWQFIYQFDINGNITFQNTISDYREKTLLQLDHHNLINVILVRERFYNEAQCVIYRKNEKFLDINLHDEFDKYRYRKEWGGYEYIESIVSTNREWQFSFINVDATYGVQGVKIFQINSSKELDLLYDMDNLDVEETFHYLTFNSKGTNFALLLHEVGHSSKERFSICEYSIENDKKPIKTYKTDYGYWGHGTFYTHYLNDSVLVIIRIEDIIIFDLTNGTTKEIIKRDFNSSYFVSFNILVYQFNGKILVYK